MSSTGITSDKFPVRGRMRKTRTVGRSNTGCTVLEAVSETRRVRSKAGLLYIGSPPAVSARCQHLCRDELSQPAPQRKFPAANIIKSRSNDESLMGE